MSFELAPSGALSVSSTSPPAMICHLFPTLLPKVRTTEHPCPVSWTRIIASNPDGIVLVWLSVGSWSVQPAPVHESEGVIERLVPSTLPVVGGVAAGLTV